MQTSSLNETVAISSEAIRQHEAHKARQARLAAMALSALPIAPKIQKIEISESEPEADTAFEVTTRDMQVVVIAQDSIIGADALIDRALIDVIERRITIGLIQNAVCRAYGCERADMLSPKRHASIVRPRQVAYFLCRKLTGNSLPHVARYFGGRDHTSALSGIRKIERLLKTEAGLFETIQSIAAKLGFRITLDEVA